MILWVVSLRGSRKEYKFSGDFLVTEDIFFPSSPSSILREGHACRGERPSVVDIVARRV